MGLQEAWDRSPSRKAWYAISSTQIYYVDQVGDTLMECTFNSSQRYICHHRAELVAHAKLHGWPTVPDFDDPLWGPCFTAEDEMRYQGIDPWE